MRVHTRKLLERFSFLYLVVSACQRALAKSWGNLRFASAKLEIIKRVRFKLLCIVNYKVNYAISIVNYAIPRAFKSLSAIIF